MKVLTITGDKNFKPGHPRFELQKNAVEDLAVVYWGRGALVPKMPAGPFDVVTVQDPFWRGLVALRIARRLKVRLNVELHTELAAQSLLRRALARRVLRSADSVRVVSAKIRDSLARFNLHAHITILPIYVDVSRFSGLPRRAHPRFGKTVLWLGRFEAEKDPLRAVGVLEEARQAGIDAGLVLLGAGSLGGALRERVKDKNLDTFVEFPGWQDPAPYFAQADAVLCTSRFEGFGASMVEALAAGVAVVAPDVGVAREAGATVVERKDLGRATIDVLRSGARGALRLSLPGTEEWARAWRQSLEA